MTPSRNNRLRIIGGKWRGRKLNFPDVAGLRPTPDRIRETLFNWLMPYIQGARCLDLFAGSGMLSFEALSRGAAQAVMVEQVHAAVKQLHENSQLLQAENQVKLYNFTFSEKLHLPEHPFNIVFLDPPFHQGLIEKACHWLGQQQLLAENALIYIESEAELKNLQVPANWEQLKNQRAGQVNYSLYLCYTDIIPSPLAG